MEIELVLNYTTTGTEGNVIGHLTGSVKRKTDIGQPMIDEIIKRIRINGGDNPSLTLDMGNRTIHMRDDDVSRGRATIKQISNPTRNITLDLPQWKQYERYINEEINKSPDTSKSYLWNDVPDKVLGDAGLITDYNQHRLARKRKKMNRHNNNSDNDDDNSGNSLKDVGIDIVEVQKSGVIRFVQCKDYIDTILVGDLAGFWMIMAKHIDKQGIVYHSTNKLSINIKENISERIQFVHKPMPQEPVKEGNGNQPIQLYDYQEPILRLYQDYYKTNDSAILSLPCGIGKTILSCFISREYDVVIFISPLKQFAEQNLERYTQYDNNRSCLLIDSDGTRDVEEIKRFIKSHTKVMLSVTYKSCDVVVNLLSFLVNPFIVVDEFHNLSARNVYGLREKDEPEEELEPTNEIKEHVNDMETDEGELEEYLDEDGDVNSSDEVFQSDSDEQSDISEHNSQAEFVQDSLYSLINSTCKKLYMSATPRVYELEDTNDCNVEQLLGKVVYKMDFKTAIENKYMCDYTMYLPILESQSKTELDGLIADIKTDLCTEFANINVAQKCCYLYECIKQFGTLKCIIYFKFHQEIYDFIDCFNKINQYYCYDYEIDSVICDDSQRKRKEKINKFKQSQVSSFLCSVGILDECIDIVECNSIYVTYNCTSKVKNVQRMCRAMRLDKRNINKIAKIILWADEISDVVTYMSAIKEIDLSYNEKVSYIKFSKGLVNENKVEMAQYIARYNQYIIGIQEYRGFNWYINAKLVEKFYIEQKRSLSFTNESEQKLARWVTIQNSCYKFRQGPMKIPQIYASWTELKLKYPHHLSSRKHIWYLTVSKVEQFIVANIRSPQGRSNDPEERHLAIWIRNQNKSYNMNTGPMKQQEIYNKWAAMKSKYAKYLSTYIELWLMRFSEWEKFRKENNRAPAHKSSDTHEKILYEWYRDQKSNYSKKDRVMKNADVYAKWTELMNKYPEHFLSIKEFWFFQLSNAYKFISTNHKRPSAYSKDPIEKTLANWIQSQVSMYKKRLKAMKSQDQYDAFTVFKTKYQSYFEAI